MFTFWAADRGPPLAVWAVCLHGANGEPPPLWSLLAWYSVMFPWLQHHVICIMSFFWLAVADALLRGTLLLIWIIDEGQTPNRQTLLLQDTTTAAARPHGSCSPDRHYRDHQPHQQDDLWPLTATLLLWTLNRHWEIHNKLLDDPDWI